MTSRMNRWVAGWALAAWLPTSLGCAQLPTVHAGPLTAVPTSVSAAAYQAYRFAEGLRAVSSVSATSIGAVVVVTVDGLQTSWFDFTGAPSTGLVRLSASGFEASLPVSALAPVGTRRVAAFEFWGWGGLAVTIALAAARALAQYYIDHPGGVDREAALGAVLAAMARPVGSAVGLNVERVDWTPIAGQLLATNSTAFTDLARTAIGLVDRIKSALQPT